MKKLVTISLVIVVIHLIFIKAPKNMPTTEMFSFYIDNQKVTNIPTIEEGYVYERSECNNDAKIVLSFINNDIIVKGITKNNTQCNLYFRSKLFLDNLATTKKNELIYDKTVDNNLRFIGANPNNYVLFNNETWRIIGVMDNIEDESGNIGSHIKIIRDSIGLYSWDSSSSNVNMGNGVNEWSEADIQKVLNENYYQKKAGGTCYSSSGNKTCPKWESIGLNDDARVMVSKVKWNTGTMPVDFNSNTNLITPIYMYEMERSENVGKICNSGNYCTDTVDRTSSWTGYVGLMYPSDYGYATSGKNEAHRQICATQLMGAWASEINCAQNSWLYDKYKEQYTITPALITTEASRVFYIDDTGSLSSGLAYSEGAIRPVIYLNSNVKIEEDVSEDYGSSSNPFRLIVT